jgi:parallel beta-helix repeat protein
MCIAIMAGVLADASFADTHYVNVNNTTPAAPYTNWATAAQEIQDAVDTAEAGDTVLVTNGVYATGGRVTPGYASSNRVVITKDITVTSVNGPAVTIIRGQGPLGNSAVRCVCMSAGQLSGFSLTNGFTRMGGDYGYDQSGGGANMYAGEGVVSNCLIGGNTASWNGGGAHEGMVQDCTITGNSAVYGGGTCYTTVHKSDISGNTAGPYGGGMYEGAVSNSTVRGNSAGQYGGGTFYTTVNHCTISGNSAGEDGGGSYGGTLNHCTISSNSARQYGGGSMYGTVYNCTISANTASGGGGTSYIALNNCTISGNTAYEGGGLHFSTANHCTISRNSAYNGGGMYDSTANNCMINGNSAYYGGAIYSGVANNCLVVSNTASRGGGACNCSLVNCTITGNVATNRGGGFYLSVSWGYILRNCIVYLNRCISNPASSNWYQVTESISYSCAAPLPSGAGNIATDAGFVNAASGDYHLVSGSPCINAGTNAPDMAFQHDLEGRPRILGGRVDMGAYEWYATADVLDPPALTAPIAVPAGGSATVMVTNWPNVMLCGEKAPGIFVAAPWLTNGVAQTLNGTAWTNAFVTLARSVTGATNVIVFRCVSNDWMTYSAATTVVVIINQQMLPFVDITNESATVPYETTTATIAGTNNAFAAGGLCWSNLLTAASGAAQGSSFAFHVSDIALAVGANPLLVYGTNTLGDTGGDSVTMTRLPEAVAPVIEPDALVFPGTNAPVLEAGMLTAIVWRVSGIWDNVDGTNLLLPSIAVLATNSGAVVAQIGTNVPNTFGALAWTPWGLESEATAYVVRIEAIDSAGNATNRVFVDNVFTVVPEPAWIGLLGLTTICKFRFGMWWRKREA